MSVYKTLIMFTMALFFTSNLAGQHKNYQYINSKVNKIPIFGERLITEVDFEEIKPKTKEAQIQKESGLGPLAALEIAATLVPKVLNFGANTVKRITKNALKKYEADFEFRQTIIYPSKKHNISEIRLIREIKPKDDGENKRSFLMALKLIMDEDFLDSTKVQVNNNGNNINPGSIFFFQVTEIEYHYSKALITSKYPYVNFEVSIELTFVDGSGKISKQKSETINIPLFTTERKKVDLKSSGGYYSSRFVSTIRPSEINMKIKEYNPAKAKFEELNEDIEQVTSDTKDISEAFLLGIINEKIEQLKKEQEKQQEQLGNDQQIEKEGGLPKNN